MQTERAKPKKRPKTKKENRIDGNFSEEHAKLDKTKSACMRTHKTTKLQQQHKQRRRRRRRHKTDRELLWMRERPPVDRLRLHCSEFVDDSLESVDDFLR